MPDREKVIQWLEICSTIGCKEGCPYKHEGLVYKADCQDELMRDALVLLKYDKETRFVRHYSRPNVYADLWLHCEKCGGRTEDNQRPKYCPNCGRKVKWDG